MIKLGAKTLVALSVMAVVCPLLGGSAWAVDGMEFTTDFRVEAFCPPTEST